MPLWTTYLSLWSRHQTEVLKHIGATNKNMRYPIHNHLQEEPCTEKCPSYREQVKHAAVIFYVMRNRGNNAVAPTKDTLALYKTGLITWEGYEARYKVQLESDEAYSWMEDVLSDLEDGLHVVLVCFEKDPAKCHRRLLAEKIKAEFPEIDYRGEIKLE